jgi:hypothetical protein
MESIKEEMRRKLSNEQAAVKEAEKAKSKVLSMAQELDAKNVKIGDLESKVDELEFLKNEQRTRTKEANDRALKLEEELKSLRSEKEAREEALASEIQDLKDESALARVVARAALMRKFVANQITPEMAESELASFRASFESEDLLDADDLKDSEEEKEDELKEPADVVIGEEDAKDKASGSDHATQVIQDIPSGAAEQEADVVLGSDIPPVV